MSTASGWCDVNPDADDLGELTSRHLADRDAWLADLDRGRETVRAVEDRVLNGDRPGDEALLDLLSVLPPDKPGLTRRITPLVYRDIAARHAIVVDVLGPTLGPIAYPSGRVTHGEVRAGDGVVSLHRRGPDHQMVSPLTAGTTSR